MTIPNLADALEALGAVRHAQAEYSTAIAYGERALKPVRSNAGKGTTR